MTNPINKTKENYREYYLYKGFAFVIEEKTYGIYSGYAELYSSAKNPRFYFSSKNISYLRKKFRKYVDSLPKECFDSYELHDMDSWRKSLEEIDAENRKK